MCMNCVTVPCLCELLNLERRLKRLKKQRITLEKTGWQKMTPCLRRPRKIKKWKRKKLTSRRFFLAAMSSSRSDVVTQFVRSFVFPFVRSSPFFSFSVLEVSSSPKVFQWCFKAV